MSFKFDDYIGTVRERANHYAKRYGMERRDLEVQGYLIYCSTLEKFDPAKGAKFNTYLTHRLNGLLGDYCKATKQKEHQCESIDDVVTTDSTKTHLDDLAAKSTTPTIDDLLHYAKGCLSDDGYSVFQWVLSRQWDQEDCKKPSIKEALWLFCGVQKMGFWRVYEAWAEISELWRSGRLVRLQSYKKEL